MGTNQLRLVPLALITAPTLTGEGGVLGEPALTVALSVARGHVQNFAQGATNEVNIMFQPVLLANNDLPCKITGMPKRGFVQGNARARQSFVCWGVYVCMCARVCMWVSRCAACSARDG